MSLKGLTHSQELLRLAEVLDLINKMETPEYFLEVQHRGTPNSAPPVRELRDALEKWLSSLDMNAVDALCKAGKFEALPMYKWSRDGLRLTFRPVPKSAQASPDARPIGINMGERVSSHPIKIFAFGADAALWYAKGAACREIDAFMTCNHLRYFLGDTYPAKIQMLSAVGLRTPDVIHQLIIDPRNESDHSYQACTSRDAKIAVEIAELFLKATADERAHHALISIGWSIGIVQQRCSVPGKEYERIEFSLTAQHAPMLLIDVCMDDHHVMILHPSDEEVSTCPLRDFKREQAIRLAQLLRRQYSLQNGTSGVMGCDWFNKLKADIGLSAIFS